MKNLNYNEPFNLCFLMPKSGVERCKDELRDMGQSYTCHQSITAPTMTEFVTPVKSIKDANNLINNLS